MTTARTSGEALALRSVAMSSSIRPMLSALRFSGRLSVMRAAGPS